MQKEKKCRNWVPNFGKLKNSEHTLCYQEPLMQLMNRHWKKPFAKLFILDYGTSTWIQSNLSGSGFLLQSFFQPNSPLSSQIRHSSLSNIFEIPLTKSFFFVLKNFRPFEKHRIALLVSNTVNTGNQYCQTEHFLILGSLFNCCCFTCNC